MIRRMFATLALAVVSFITIPTALAPGANAAPPGPIQACMNGGWQTFAEASGQPFANQGRCISYFILHPVTLADLAGSFSGTTSFSIRTGGCSTVEQVFDATYPGNSAVGSVTLHLDGCVNTGLVPFTYAGTFALTTSVGTLTGNAAGPINNVPVSPPLPGDFELTLTLLSGSGAFAGTSGLIDVQIVWPFPYGTQVSGSVSVP
jgi:hypothetical protein